MQYSTAEFETLYKRCFPSSMRMAMSLLHEEDEARDVVQEVFARLWESKVRIENPMAFTMRAVRNACINRINLLDKRERIRRRLTLEPPPPDDDFDPMRRAEAVSEAIRLILTPRQKQVVDKIYSEGMSYKETAESLGVSVAAVNKNIVAALKRLRSHFNVEKS